MLLPEHEPLTWKWEFVSLGFQILNNKEPCMLQVIWITTVSKIGMLKVIQQRVSTKNIHEAKIFGCYYYSILRDELIH